MSAPKRLTGHKFRRALDAIWQPDCQRIVTGALSINLEGGQFHPCSGMCALILTIICPSATFRKVRASWTCSVIVRHLGRRALTISTKLRMILTTMEHNATAVMTVQKASAMSAIKALVLDSVHSEHSRRAYDKGLTDFLTWRIAPSASIQWHPHRLNAST
jgi:hypothetical protein